MRKINVLIIIAFFVCIILFIQSVSALTANSSSYSVNMFGTGMATANPSSTNYNSTALTEAQGTTRNAESGTYTTNIGFFENTIYYRTVSITSYSIYPKSAVQGSIIRLSISALNSQSVWAVLTLPDNTQETIALVNNGDAYYTANSVGVYTVTFYANSSQGNLASVIDTFEITSTVIPPVTPPSSGGGGTTIVIEKCTYIWDCTSWSICSEGKQQRECKNIGNCTGTEGKPIETRECSDALFDVVMKFNDIELTTNKTLKFGIDLTETKGIEKIDVQIKYSIIDSNNTEIFSQIETRAIQRNLTYEKEISEIKLKNGEYTLRVDIIYGNQQRAFAEQKFEVIGEKIGIKEPASKFNYNVLVLISIVTVLLLLAYLLFRLRKNNLLKIFGKIVKSKRKYFAYALVALLFAAVLTIILKTNITGRVINNILPQNSGRILSTLIILAVLALLIILRKKIIGFLSNIFIRCNKHPKNSIKGWIGKKVYSENGNYVGKITDIILGENRIDSLKIKIDKKHKLNTRGIIIDYKQVKSVSEIVIINESVVEHLEGLCS